MCKTDYATPVSIRGRVPVVSMPTAATIREGSTFTATGSFANPGVSAWTASVDYGDGTGVKPLALNADRAFALSHVYADDGAYTVTVRVTSAWATGTATAVIAVSNAAPAIAIGGASSVDEGSLYSLTLGAVTDPGADTVTSWVVHWGDGTSTAFGTNGVKTHIYADGSNRYAVAVELVDEDGTFVNRANTLSVTVANVAPTAILGGLTSVNQGTTYSLTLSGLADPGLDTATGVVIGWGDGTSDALGVSEVAALRAGGSIQLRHVYVEGGVYIATATIADEDGTFGPGTTLGGGGSRAIAVSSFAGATLDGNRLVIVGTAGNDDIQVHPGVRAMGSWSC